MLIEQPQLRPEVSIRWLTIACFEIRVGDFRIVIDPCIGESPRAPFGPEVIEGADIVLLSHTHWDHITDLAYVMEKFHCPVLCGELSAPALIEMLNANPIEERQIVVCDPMLATGGSAVDAIDQIKKHGGRKIKFICIIAAPEGVKRLAEAHPDVQIYVGNLDRCLNENAYICPGLGDAGDRIFGTK